MRRCYTSFLNFFRVGKFWQSYKCRQNRKRAGMVSFGPTPFLLFLQITGKPFSIQDNQLIQYLIPVPVSLRPLFDYIFTGKVQHFFQGCITWEYTFCFRDFPVMAVQSLYDICRVHNTPDILHYPSTSSIQKFSKLLAMFKNSIITACHFNFTIYKKNNFIIFF